MKKNPVSKIIFILFCLAMVLCLTGAAMFSSVTFGQVMNSRLDTEYAPITDYQVEELQDPQAPAGVVKEYRWTLELGTGHPGTLAFYSAHHYIEVFLDGELVCALSQDACPSYSKTPGNGWVLLPFTEGDQGKELCIRVTPVYSYVKNRVFDFYIGSEAVIFTHQLRRDLPQILLGEVVSFAGLVFVIASCYNRMRKKKRADLFYLGIFSVIIGMWKLTDTRSLPLLFPKHILLLTYLPLAMLLLAPIPMLQFVKSILERKKLPLLDGCSLLSALATLVMLAMQLTGVMDLRQTLTVCHTIIALSSMAATFELIRFWRKNRKHKRVNFTFACLLACTLGACIDLIVYYVRGNSTSILYTLSIFLFYVIVMGAMTMRDMNTLASTDQHTGLYNRNRCNEILETELTAGSRVSVFMFDLNDLKHINDTQGHDQGDRILLRFAEILRDGFPSDAFVGRYGGDEFIAVIKESGEDVLQSILDKIRQAAEDYNRLAAGEGLPALSYAWGYATSVQMDLSAHPSNLYDLLRMADGAMYENKKAFHEMQGIT
ncbi:MAG: GGDEF domain-containing protein [Anaerovoracaceae bacterium]